jgi:predicted DNA-binding transcriptional regulator YafY
MRRADRLFQIVQLLRQGGVVTASALASDLEVSARTVYRDIADLIASGVPIEGEAGVGYCLRRGFDLPPLMFDAEEIGALVLGVRMVQAFGDERLARAARGVLGKVEAVVPARLQDRFEQPQLAVWAGLSQKERTHVATFRRGIDERRKVAFAYVDQQGRPTRRTVRPLLMAFWGSVWTAGAWCELRADFRSFRPDRMGEVALLDETFEDEPDRNLESYLRVLHEEIRLGREGRRARTRG